MTMRAEISTAIVGEDDTTVRVVVNRLGDVWIPSHAIELKGDCVEHINLPSCFRLNADAVAALDKLVAESEVS